MSFKLEEYLDFPIKGIGFFDIGSMLFDQGWIIQLADEFKKAAPANLKPDYIVGIESRGLIFGSAACLAYGCGMVMARKPGKLPGELAQGSYDKEYGKDTIEIQKNKMVPGKKYLVVDDILATGNTAITVANMLSSAGADVLGVMAFGEIKGLGGREKLKDYNVYTCEILVESV